MESRLIQWPWVAISVFILTMCTALTDTQAQNPKVKKIVRTENSLHYLFDEGSVSRTLHLYNTPGLRAAVVTNTSRQILSMMFSMDNPTGRGSQKVTFLFRPNSNQAPDRVSQAALRPEYIAKLPLPRRSGSDKWKNSARFLNSMENNDKAVLVTGGTFTMARRTRPIKDAVCDPSISIQLNSATNACFQALCDYLQCVEKNGTDGCTEDAQKASAYCFASGDNVFKLERY